MTPFAFLRSRPVFGALIAAALTTAPPLLAYAEDSAPAEPSMADMPMHDHGAMGSQTPMPSMASPEGDSPPMDMGAGMTMTGALGGYPMSREASGTSWQPDASPHSGVESHVGDWTVMTHALFTAVSDHQGGPRGGDKTFFAGMAMAMASRPLADGGTLGLRAMLSPDPLMGPKGYPLLLATGETADGATLLVDRQHPHDLIMELSASYSRPISDTDSLYLYAGLPGEPAFGPPAFMHRLSGLDIPEAPITHHWLDSTHITFGVVTAGWSHGGFKLEGSAFNGREPDQHRWNIETGAFSSWSARASWNPAPNWSFQASTALLKSPEILEPDVNERRWSASAIYTRPIGAHGLIATTLAWGRKELQPGPTLDAWLIETAVRPDARWTLFGRAERAEQAELDGHGGHIWTVGKLSLGAIYDIPVGDHWSVGVGGLVSAYSLPEGLKGAYGSPTSTMAFVRLKLS